MAAGAAHGRPLMGASMNDGEATSLEPTTRRPPATILVIGAAFLAIGCLDLYRGIAPLAHGAPPAQVATYSITVGLIGVAALVGAGFLLAGRNWARWLLAAWMALHVAISWGEPAKLAGHAVIFGLIAFLLFRPGIAAYFRRGATA